MSQSNETTDNTPEKRNLRPGRHKRFYKKMQATNHDNDISAPQQYPNWLPVLGKVLGCAVRGSLVIFSEGKSPGRHFHHYPKGCGSNEDLIRLCDRVRQESKGVVHILTREQETSLLAHIGAPVTIGSTLLVYAFEITPSDKLHVNRVMFQLEYGLQLLRETDLLVQAEAGAGDERVEQLLSLVTGCMTKEDFTSTARHLVNSLHDRFSPLRVSLGSVLNNAVQIEAISHQHSPEKTSQLAVDIRLAMEECWDQGVAVRYPENSKAQGPACLLHRNLVSTHGGSQAYSIPMKMTSGTPSFVLLVETAPGVSQQMEQESDYHLAARMLGPVLALKKKEEQSLTATFAGKVRTFRKSLTAGAYGPLYRYLPVVLFLLFTLFARGEFRVPADVQLTGTILRAIVAPFPGYIASSEHSAGDHVETGETLATLDTSDLTLEELNWSSRYAQADLEYRKAIANNATSQAKIVAQQKKQAEIQLSLLKLQKERALIRAPFSGTIVSGDLTQSVGSPVERGKPLFEMVPVDGYRVLAEVDEKDISYLEKNQQGSLVFNSLPRETFHFTVTKITPVATAKDGRNTFRVEAKLVGGNSRLQPGMKGFGKIGVGTKPLLWLWTRTLRERLHLLYWTMMP